MNFSERIEFFQAQKKFLTELIYKYNLKIEMDSFIIIDSKLNVLSEAAGQKDEPRFRHNSGELGRFLDLTVCKLLHKLLTDLGLTHFIKNYEYQYTQLIKKYSPVTTQSSNKDKKWSLDHALQHLLESIDSLSKNKTNWPLPFGVTTHVLSFLDPDSKMKAVRVCQLWQKASQYNEFDLFVKYVKAAKSFHYLIADSHAHLAFFDLEYQACVNGQIESLPRESDSFYNGHKSTEYIDRGLNRIKDKAGLEWEIKEMKNPSNGKDEFTLIIKKFDKDKILMLLAELKREIASIRLRQTSKSSSHP